MTTVDDHRRPCDRETCPRIGTHHTLHGAWCFDHKPGGPRRRNYALDFQDPELKVLPPEPLEEDAE